MSRRLLFPSMLVAASLLGGFSTVAGAQVFTCTESQAVDTGNPCYIIPFTVGTWHEITTTTYDGFRGKNGQCTGDVIDVDVHSICVP